MRMSIILMRLLIGYSMIRISDCRKNDIVKRCALYRNAMLCLFFIFFSCLICEGLWAQSPVYKNYTVNDGLPSQVVYCALQDHQGYMWFGTDAGVSRFDGKEFQNYTNIDGLSDNEVLKVYEDSKNRIWFLMLNGTLSYYQDGSIYNGSTDLSIGSIKTKRELMSFYEDSDSNIWFGSAGGELVYLPKEGKARILNLEGLEIYTTNRLVYVFQDASRLMVIVGSSLFLMHNFNFELVDTSIYISKNRPFIVVESFDSSGVAVSYNDGIRQLYKGQNNLILPKHLIKDYESVQRMFIDRKSGIWLITSNLSTYHYQADNNGRRLTSVFLPGMYVGAVYDDQEGNIWFCTIGSGILRLSGSTSNIKVFEGPLLLSDKEIWSVNINKANDIWFGTGSRILYRIRNDSVDQQIDLGSELYRMGRITRIEFDEVNNIWCSASNGIANIKLNANGKFSIENVTTLTSLKHFNAKYIRFDTAKQLYFSSFRGIQKIYKDDKLGYVYRSFIPASLDTPARVYCLYFDKMNRLWYEKFNTLFSYDGRNVVRYASLSNIFKSQISSIEGFLDSTIIISTYGNGVHFFRNGKIINHISTSDGLAGDLCRKVFVDSTTIYVATNQGFSFFNYHNNVISDIRTITMADGIVSNDVKDICARGENIYLATSAGLCIVKKSIAQTSSVPPPVYITSVFSRDSIMKDLTKLRFSYAADFSLNYIAITFEQPEKIVYQYNVSGNESDWIETNNSSIAFSSLSPGDYTFQLRAKKYNSDWSKITTLQFTVVPPMWEQWWFRSLIFMFLAGLTYLTLRFAAERRYKVQLGVLREKQVLADERSRIAADMHDDLGADLSNLLLMSRMSESNESFKPAEAKHSSRFENYVSELIGKVDEIIWALNPRNDTLKGTIEYIRDYVSKTSQLIGLELFVSIPEVLPVDPVSAKFRRSLFLVVKESLNNIHHHSSANKLTLTFDIAEGHLLVFFEDNGKGFDVNTTQTGADGLFNMKKRIEELGGKFFLNSEIGAGSSIRIDVAYI